jgi:cell division protein FtsL
MDINPSLVLSLALATVPTMLTVLIGILINNSRLGDVNSRINDLRSHMDSRFDEMRSSWQSELRRVEDVFDARLKHLEER